MINKLTADVSLAIESRAAVPAPVELSLLDVDGKVRAERSQTVRLSAGSRSYKFLIPIGSVMRDAGSEIGWWRLRYRVGGSTGIVSLSELLRGDFELRAAAFQRVAPGEPIRVRVRALDPYKDKGVRGVAITGVLIVGLDTEEDEDELKLIAKGRTDGDGFAILDFRVPANIKWDGDEIDIKITGQKNGVVREIDDDIDTDDRQSSVLLTADKPLYQPGQTFNVRGLFLDPNNTVVAGAELEFKIEDEDDTVVFRQTVKTSEYGIAAISWPIPESAKLGSYRVIVEADDDLREDQLVFKISRYDLPNFSVVAKPDQTYYLPTETQAAITVNADYLFGKPVTRGKVRVVEESDRKWNWREQRYDVTEGAVVEGQTDASGKFVAKIDLKKDIAELREHEWKRFEDLTFSAYFTDLTTNRTEQRRFDIRLTKEPIHIYLMRYAEQHEDLPLTAYVSTFYADGTPASCTVEVADAGGTVERFKTNSLGAGKFEVRIPPERIKSSEYEIRITARDREGRQGRIEESYYLSSNDAVRITTDKTIYSPGEPVEVDLMSSRKSGFVYVDVVSEGAPIESHTVELRGGRAHLTLPYRPAFAGELTIAAYTDEEDGRWYDEMRAARGIIFPQQRNLVLDAKFTKETYKPGEDAVVRFAVRDAQRRPFESAIGLGIFDKAIEERARTDAEFGGYFDRFYRLMGYERSFGNLSVKDLNDLDMSRPPSPEMQLAAEIMLAGGRYYPEVFHSGNIDARAKDLYSGSIAKQLAPIAAALDAQYAADFSHPTDRPSLERILAARGVDLAQMLDPWGNAYSAAFTVDRTHDVVTLRSSGPDKQPGTADDFDVLSKRYAYFTKTGEAIDRASGDYHTRTGRYIRDLATLSAELAKQGVDPASLTKDRWGRDHRITFEVAGRNYLTRIYSLGPNGVYDGPQTWRGDDVEVWKSYIDHFGDSERDINRALDLEINQRRQPFPRNEAEFAETLRRGGIDLASIRDGYGQPVYVTAVRQTRYADKTTVENGKTKITPVTEELMVFKVNTAGEDRASDTDDAVLATFSSVITEAHKGTGFAMTDVSTTVFSGAKGAIKGTVVDPTGAVVAGAAVTATDINDEAKTSTVATDENGEFLLNNLPSGTYRVKVEYSGFRSAVTTVQVRSQTLVQVNLTLEVAGTTEVVTVAGSREESVVNVTNSKIETTVTKTKAGAIRFPYAEQTSTPRLREYFPETLVWRPEVVTDKRGRAEVAFKMADNITTWKMFAIASTKKGKIGVIEKEITAFQPFFVDLDPPKFLTAGDEIWLPTQVRNYTERPQRVDVTLDKAAWFTLLGGERKQVDVASGSSENAVFGFRAHSPVKDGKQRVTAIARSDSDAIERAVTVRPDGEEIVRTDSRVFERSTKFEIDFPANALAGTQRAEIKIYPNLFSHVADSVEGLLQRPYGCGEQTISSTYPNLMILKFAAKDSALRGKAERYLRKGYERLAGYQTSSGGFSYWGPKDSPDIALTAYAIRFLNDARPFVDVDEGMIERAQSWLVSQQRADGSWNKRYNWETADDPNRTKLITSYVARALAMPRPDRGDAKSNSQTADSLRRALGYLKNRNAEIDEPYALALFGLASLDAGDKTTATEVAERLAKMAHAEGPTSYWKLETNTPFYGWGTAGRIETTALVLQLLTKTAAAGESRGSADLRSRALLFLLKNKDRYGVWYSTQTTINVLDAFLATLAAGAVHAGEQTVRVSANGAEVASVAVEPDRIDPIIVDLHGRLDPAKNTIEIDTGASGASVMAQAVATHYIDWRDSASSTLNAGESRAVRLDYKCDKPSPAIMEEVTCSVEAERIGFRGYGMLLAEIGTPPGVDVSRESLERALESDWSLSRYEILPDRIVLYMWAKAGGTKFDFKFKPRYGINAQTPASSVYDYYNPEARAVARPLRFATRAETRP
ncbi:MAG: MG2 domain-containing protein [Pyrinomonadaceae bacterium]